MARIDDGHGAIISFASKPNIKFWEKTVTPPGVDGGGENDTTTMRNAAWRTKAPKKLKSLTDVSTTVAYDPAVYDEVLALLQVNDLVTTTFPDGSSLTFWGWLDAFAPSDLTEGEQPTADITVKCSNQNASGVEVAPVYAANALAAPANLTSTDASSLVTLDWDAVAGAATYNVYRSIVSGSGYVFVGSTPSNTFIDNSVTGGTDYYYLVRAVSADGVLGTESAELLAEPLA